MVRCWFNFREKKVNAKKIFMRDEYKFMVLPATALWCILDFFRV